MKIVLYSTNSNTFDETSIRTRQYPSCAQLLENSICTDEHEITIFTQLPGLFLVDLEKTEIKQKCSKVRYIIAKSDTPKDIAQEISELNPDMAIAASFWVRPFDWLSIKDAMIGELLQAKGIKTVCHPLETTIDCFDKWRTHTFLEKYGFPTAKAIYVHHELYMNAGNRRELKANIYQQAIHAQIKKLHYPVLIKDTTGLSSFGMDKVDSYPELARILQSKRFTADKIIEEYIQGEQFGTEIHGTTGNYQVFPPFFISTNKYGITSPKQNVKFGPVQNPDYKTEELKNQLTQLAEKLELNGIAQVDLIFSNGKWHIIEINTRLSGMSQTYAACCGKSIHDLLVNSASGQKNICKNIILDIKMPLPDDDTFNMLKESSHTIFISKTENPQARQFREEGFCQLIIGAETLTELNQAYLQIKEKLPQEEQNLCESFMSEHKNSILKN